jgi:hypothetical protein
MGDAFRRYEILLPRQFNDQQEIPEEFFVETVLELKQQFGAASSESQIIRGFWEHRGQTSREKQVRIFVDVPDSPETRQFFREYKDRLKARFQQIDIWMTSHPIDVI